MMINDAFRSGGVSSAELTRIHSERFASMKNDAVARTPFNAFRNGGPGRAGAWTQIPRSAVEAFPQPIRRGFTPVESLGEALSRNEDAER
jgi:hypothetical protein